MQSLKSITIQGLDIVVKAKAMLIGIVCVGLGVSFGYLINNPEAGELVVSIITLLLMVLIIMKNPLYGLLVWLFLKVFIDSWVKIPMGAGIPDMSFSRFVIAFLVIFMLAQAAIGKLRFARVSWPEVFIIATFVGIASAAPLSIKPGPKGVFQSALTQFFIPMSAYFFAKNLVRNKADLHKVLWVIAILGFVSGLYAAYEHATGNILFVSKDKVFDESDFFRGESTIRQINGIMGNSTAMGTALAMTISVTFYLFLESKKPDVLRKILLAGMLVAQFYGIIIAMKRTPWYALLLALFVMQIFYPQFRKLFWIIVFIAAIVLSATWDQVTQSQVAERVNDKVSTLDGREARWDAGINMWKAKPIRGWGFGWFQEKSGQFRVDGEKHNFKNGAIESDYLDILVSTGLIGLLPYLLFILITLLYSLIFFFRARAPDWPGFIKVEMLTVYWAVIICLLVTAYTARQTQPLIRMMPFVVGGATVGCHEYLLRRVKKVDDQSQTRVPQPVT